MKMFLGRWASLLLALTVVSCAGTYRGQNRIQESTITIHGGVYKDLEWDEDLELKRTSFFQGANMHYDVMISELNKDSEFKNWLGSDEKLLQSCNQFFVALLYRNQLRGVGHSTVIEQLRGLGREIVEIPSFKSNFRQHYMAKEMNFIPYRVKGICVESAGSLDKLEIFIPGFKQQDIL
ncbi:MAG: hypothetical protein CME64_10270 [Halobacteriovoraceae bacterium]|nr:hypothetical protein [Halobacteriovoraceae bacterium]|tara:strand:+ start:139384 stop:139920 length:537 start_codon:yes stop_codon:yes gene_type:complete